MLQGSIHFRLSPSQSKLFYCLLMLLSFIDKVFKVSYEPVPDYYLEDLTENAPSNRSRHRKRSRENSQDEKTLQMCIDLVSSDEFKSVITDLLRCYKVRQDKDLDDHNAAAKHIKHVMQIKKCSAEMKKLKSIDEAMK